MTTPATLLTLLLFATSFLGNFQAQEPSAMPNPSRLAGMKAALGDREKGILMLKEYPPLPYSLREMKFIRLLKKNCNVGREVVKLPREKKGIPDKAVIQEVRGYNDVMKMEIKHQFGQDIFEKLRAQARQ